MKLKHFAIIILTSLLIVTVFGSVTVFAPAPTTSNPNSILDAFVTNTNDDPVPVTITDEPIEVTLDEPVEVAGTVGIDDADPVNVEGTVGIDDADPIDVEIANSEGLPLDVSGWLHTTQSEGLIYVDVSNSYWQNCLEIESTGYKTITIKFAPVTYGCDIKIAFIVEDFIIDGHQYSVGTGDYFVETYNVCGDTFRVEAHSQGLSSCGLYFGYYMTT